MSTWVLCEEVQNVDRWFIFTANRLQLCGCRLSLAVNATAHPSLDPPSLTNNLDSRLSIWRYLHQVQRLFTVCCRFAEANGKLGAQEPKAEGGVSAQDPGVPYGLLHPDWIPDRYYYWEPVQTDLGLCGAHGGLVALQKGWWRRLQVVTDRRCQNSP